MRDGRENHWDSNVLAAWAKDQGGRNVASAVNRGGTAVTGHGQAKGGRSMTPSSSSGGSQGSRKLAKGPSMLAAVQDKQSRFN